MRPRTAVIVAPSPVPLRLGGAERHWETLRRSLEDSGIAADLVKLPVREFTLVDLVNGYEDFQLLDLSHVDLVITGKYPAWMVQHPNHVVWMLHPLRGLYDTYNPAAHEADVLPETDEVTDLLDRLDAFESALDGAGGLARPADLYDAVRSVADRLGPEANDVGGALALPGPLARRTVHLLDRWALGPTRITKACAISEVVAARTGYFRPDDNVEVIHPPSCLPEPETVEGPGEGFLAVGRLDPPKRFDLAISAFRHLHDPDARLTIVGDGPDRERLESIADGDTRIEFVGRVDDAALRTAYRKCRAVVVTPEDEDFGYITIEAMQHGRPVVTTSDSGGPAELATDSVDSLVSAPGASALSKALDRLHSDANLANRLGEAGRATAKRHSWAHAVDRLVAAPPIPEAAPGRRGHIVAVSTYPVADWPGGGPERARHLLGGLATRGWDVRVVALADPTGMDEAADTDPADPTTGSLSEVSEGITQMAVPTSARHTAAEAQLRRLTANVSITDIAASVLWPSSPELVRELRHALRGASAAIAVQPYLAGAIVALAPDIPLVFDDHNHERTLKAQILPDDEAGRWMVDRVAKAESVAAGSADLVVVTTNEDRLALESDQHLESGSVKVIPNGVDVSAVAFTSPKARAELGKGLLASLDAPAEAQHVALFVGSAHRPNVEAAAEVLRVAADHPEVLFVLAGEHSKQVVAKDCGPNVRRLGAVDAGRLAELLAGAHVALNPMRHGGGSNLKLLSYFAAGVPVVTTPMGARGVPDPSSVARVARVDRFATALTESLAEPDHDKVLAARALVESEFDWPVLAARFATAVDRAISISTGNVTDDQTEGPPT